MRVYSNASRMFLINCQRCKEQHTMIDLAICDMGFHTEYYCIPCFNKTFEHKITKEMIKEHAEWKSKV